jgi:hypothetical protein
VKGSGQQLTDPLDIRRQSKTNLGFAELHVPSILDFGESRAVAAEPTNECQRGDEKPSDARLAEDPTVGPGQDGHLQ